MGTIKRYLFILEIVFIILFCPGCVLDSDQITIILPDPPKHWVSLFKNMDWIVRWTGWNGKVMEQTVPGSEKQVELDFPLRDNQPVTAECIIKGGNNQLLPAGGVYPADCGDNGLLLLSWENGFAAELLLKLSSQGYSLEGFNYPRFSGLLLKKAEGDPWKIDPIPILRDFKAGTFNSLSVVERQEAAVSNFPAGAWVCWNPLMPRLKVTEGDTVLLPEGYHRFYSQEGTISLTVSSEKPCQWFFDTY